MITPRLFQFLVELQANNQREWFAEEKRRYESDVLLPAVAFLEQLEKPLAKVAPMLSVVPKKHGGSVMRIYRDTRFGKDKTPYKTNVGISIRHQADDDIHAPGIYIHLEPGACFLGAGCWKPARDVLAAIRSAIDDNPQGWRRARTQTLQGTPFEIGGEQLKTCPRGYDKNHPLIDDLRRTDFIVMMPLAEQDFTDSNPVPTMIRHIRQVKPWMRFLCEAINVPY